MLFLAKPRRLDTLFYSSLRNENTLTVQPLKHLGLCLKHLLEVAFEQCATILQFRAGLEFPLDNKRLPREQAEPPRI